MFKYLVSSIALFISINVYSFNLTPLSQSILAGKNKNTTIYQVENKTKEPMALEISVVERRMNLRGKEKRPEVKDGLFLVFPTQIILKPGQKRGIKVQWLGKENFTQEQNYRLLVEQLPIDFAKAKGSGIKMLLRYLGTLYVTKNEFEPKIDKVIWKKKKDHVDFTINNIGKSHKILGNLKIIIKDKAGKRHSISSEKLAGFSGENILANSSRIFSVAISNFKGINLTGASIDIEYE